MKKNRKWFKKLTKKQQFKFERNYINERNNAKKTLNEFYNEENEYFHLFLMSGFVFNRTNEGYKYWMSVVRLNS